MADYCYCDQCGVRIVVSETHCSSCGADLFPFAQIDKGGQGEFLLPTLEEKDKAPKGSAPNRASQHAARARTSMPADFKFARDFAMIDWKVTGQVNLIRAAFAGPVLGLLIALSSGSPKMFFTYALLFPFMYIVALVPMALVAYWLSSLGVPVVGWIALALSFMVALGDPFTSILSKKRPDLVPVESFGLFNLKSIIFILNKPEAPPTIPESTKRYSKTHEPVSSALHYLESQAAQATPPEVDFLSEAAEIPTSESVGEVHNRALDMQSRGDTAAAIRLCNAALRMEPDPPLEISLHHNRAQAIVEHFELNGRNKMSHRLPDVMAREHVILNWEAIIGLWVQNSPSFSRDALECFGPVFDHVYVNYLPISYGLWGVVGSDGKSKSYERRIPIVWDISWIADTKVLVVNGREYPQYKLKKPQG